MRRSLAALGLLLALGPAVVQAVKKPSPRDLRQADEAMYRAKETSQQLRSVA